MFIVILASAHGDDDFEPVAIGDKGVLVRAARDDLAVALDGDALARVAQRLDQIGHRGGLDGARFPVQYDIHGAILVGLGRRCGKLRVRSVTD